MEIIHRIYNGFDCRAGILPHGWFAGASILRDFDAEYLSELGRFSVSFKPGKEESGWNNAIVSSSHELLIISCTDGQIKEEGIIRAERITGFAACSGNEPVIVWTELKDGVWRLLSYRKGRQKLIFESMRMLRSPQAVMTDGRILTACESSEKGYSFVSVRRQGDEKSIIIEGRNPQLTAIDADSALIMVEQRNLENVNLLAYKINSRSEIKPISVLQAGDYNFNAHLACRPSDGTMYAVFEVCPRWGMDERVCLHRDISLIVLNPGADRFEQHPYILSIWNLKHSMTGVCRT